MKNKKIITLIIFIIVLLLTTCITVVHAAFTSNVTYTTNMTMPDDIKAMIGG